MDSSSQLISFKNRPAALIAALACLLLVGNACRNNRSTETGPSAENRRLQTKYAPMLGVPESEIKNFALYGFIDDWYGTSYLYGGKTKSGIDCSGLVGTLYKQVYQKDFTGPSASMHTRCEKRTINQLQEGDLVFFKIGSNKISHVGVYLKNRRFVHASTKKGVIISSLDETYYKTYFFEGGKPKF
ncbi:MAG: C40 family peptidase [Bacteroidia bacterium]